MTKTKSSYQFSLADFLRFSLSKWRLFLVFLCFGLALASFSVFRESNHFVNDVSFSISNDQIINYSNLSPFAAMSKYILSEEVYKAIGVDASKINFNDFKVVEAPVGVFKLSGQGNDFDKLNADLDFILEHLDEVARFSFKDSQNYHIIILKRPSAKQATSFQTKRIFSFAIITIASLCAALALSFYRFNKISSKA